MPSFCVVADCEYKYAQSASISFHKFPFHTASLLHQWIAFTERGPLWQPSRWSSICSRHFQATDYRDHLFRKCLKRTAVPTVRARPTFEFVDTPMQCEAVVDQQKTADESFTVSPTTTETSNNEQEHMSINPSTLQMPSRTQPSSPTLQIQQPQTSESHCILLQNCRLCARSDPNSHHLDETAIATAIQKCCPTVHLDMDVRLSRQVCSECVIELNSFVQFIDRIVSTETELQRRLCSTSPSINTASASVAPPVTNITDSVAITTVVAAKPTATPAIGVNRQHSIQSTQPAKLLHIKQEPSLLLANVKQEFVDRTTAGAAAIASTATMTPNGISMMTATTFDIANCDLPAVPLMQPVKYAPCQEIQPDNDAFCEFCDVYFINNLELKTHIVNYHNSTTSENAHEDTTSSYPNNCEIMEIITLENAFINLAEEAEQPEACGNEVLQDHHNLVVSEDMIPLERVLKVEHFNDYEQREQHSLVIRREHSYCRRSDGRFASITIPDGGDLKQEIKSTELVSEMPIPQHHLPPQNQPTQCLVPLIKCTECTETFGTAHQKLAHHYRVHRGISSSQLRRRHRLPTILHCTNCAQRFGSKVAWRNHRNVCERWYRMLTRFLRAHGSLRTRVLGRLRSAIAGRILAVRRRRATNDRATKDDDRFECRSCGRSYVQYESYQRHLKLHQPMVHEKHANRSAIECDATTSEPLFAAKPTDPADSTLPKSQEAFFQPATEPTSSPLRTTEPQNAAACVKCVTHCTHTSDYETHNANNIESVVAINNNTADRPYACATCNKRFRCAENLRQHATTHTTERKYACELCEKTFKRPVGLKQHVQGFHYKIRPHVCPVCRYAYALKGDMKRCRHSTMKTNHSHHHGTSIHC